MQIGLSRLVSVYDAEIFIDARECHIVMWAELRETADTIPRGGVYQFFFGPPANGGLYVT